MSVSDLSIAEIRFERMDGSSTSLAEYRGKVTLVVNVASKCGLTPQYAGLEALYKAHQAQGLMVLGFPANNFAGQEPGTNEEIAQFCSLTYDVTFPVFAKISVTGADMHPLYRALTAAAPTATVAGDSGLKAKLEAKGMKQAEASSILWNFEKFLLARDGSIAARFAPDMTVDDPHVLAAIEAELAKP